MQNLAYCKRLLHVSTIVFALVLQNPLKKIKNKKQNRTKIKKLKIERIKTFVLKEHVKH